MVGFAFADLQPPAGLRIAGIESGPSARSMQLKDAESGEDLHVLKVSVLTMADLKSAKVEPVAGSEEFQISVELKDLGARHLKDYTAAHHGARMAIVVNNRLLAAPVIRATIEDGKFVVGKMSRAEAEKLADAINSPPPPPPTEKENVRRTIRKNLFHFKNCYEAEAKANPAVKDGKVVLAWTINDLGDVIESKVASSQLQNRNVEQCLLNVLRAVKFPSPPQGRRAEVSYPFVFSKVKK